MARTTYRIEHSKDGSRWRTFMAWSGLQKCRAEGAFGILMSMYDGVWYRLVEEGGQVIEVSHHAEPSVGNKPERLFTESEVKAMASEIVEAAMAECNTVYHTDEDAEAEMSAMIRRILERHGVVLDPA